MPAVITHNTARAPVLAYNSQHAHPHVLVPVNVTIPSGSGLPALVTATLWINGLSRATGSWNGSDWGSAGSTRRVVLGVDATDLTTGLHGHVVEVRRESAAGAVLLTQSAELVVVNRSTSPYGAGWWIAGVEELRPISLDRKLWIGGDGSARIYYPTAIANRWAASPMERPDTLSWDGTQYVRHLSGRGRIRFSSGGQHVATVTRLGDSTIFQYAGPSLNTALTQIVVPGGLAINRVSPGTDDRVAAITVPGDPVARTTVLTRQGGDRLVSLADPDTTTVTFGYEGTSPRIRSRSNRRQHLTTYAFDGAGKLSQVSVDMGPNEADLVTGYRDLASRGLPGGTFGPAVSAAGAYTMFDAPRSDVADSTLVWLDGRGAPVRIRDALGLETVLVRGDSVWPALVTETRSPTGMRVVASYDARGNRDTSTAINPLGDGIDATTAYAWPRGGAESLRVRERRPGQLQ